MRVFSYVGFDRTPLTDDDDDDGNADDDDDD